MEKITVAILCKQKAHCLPLYLKCIYNQTYPKKLINIYIRSNNNTDNSIEILQNWINEHINEYYHIHYDFSDIDQTKYKEKIENLSPHDWTRERFLILGNIRNLSLQWAYENNSHYFVCDCDNFIIPSTLEDLFKTNLPIVGPLLHRHNHPYSNYHDTVDSNGYMKQTDAYFLLLEQKIKSLVAVDVIHCVYFIKYDILNKINYIDNTGRHEYVIFSNCARKQNILQFLDTRKIYGKISFADTFDELKKEAWYTSLNEEKILIISPQAGFGNRLRAMASGLAIALREKYTPYYLWENIESGPIINMKHYRDFFEEIIPEASSNIVVEEVLSEWIPGDGWYYVQNGGQKKMNCANIRKIRDVFQSDKNVILLETSLQLNVSDEEMINAYKLFFKPRNKFIDILNIIPNLDIGISIRRGNLLDYYLEARQSKEDIISWINLKFQGSMIIFSDDWEFRDDIKNNIINNTFYEHNLTLEKWEISFIEFLILAYKCNKIYGTPMSSFAEEAGKFGGRNHYSKILS